MNNTLSELEATLESYKQSLEQVKLLRASNNDPGTIKLETDLTEAIELTESLISLKQQDKSEEELAKLGPIANVGDYCYGLYEGLWYVAKVTKVNVPEPNTQEGEQEEASQMIDYFVWYVGYGNTAVLNVEHRNIKKYFDPPKEYLTQGTRVYAASARDNKYYEANIDTVTDNQTVWVTFKNKSVQETPLHDIRLLDNTEIYQPSYKQNKKPEENVGSKRKSTGEGDTQPPKKKKKKDKSAKKLEAEEQLNKRADSWKNFMNKNASRIPPSSRAKPAARTMTQESTFKPLQSSRQRAVTDEAFRRDK
ncbi:splicing factor [Acrasis kona]|uniref:Splicing factor n=1 Tax=Acrasis kona TaxID=1008807 RepID=A0AAW2ZEB2_9EUKA